MNTDEAIAKLKSHGDPVERTCAERVRAAIPSYARIWADYVGNDGEANALPMTGVKNDAIKSRAECWQRIYTIFESLALSWQIEEEIACMDRIEDFKRYAQNLNLWMAFFSHLGRIHDMVKGIVVPSPVNRADLLGQFTQFWKERHIVLHGRKVPMCWIDNVLAVPPLAVGRSGWHDKMPWEELKKSDFEFMAVAVSSTLREVENRVEWCLAELAKSLPSDYGWNPISWPQGNTAVSESVSLSSSSSVLADADSFPVSPESGSFKPSGGAPM